MMRLNLLRRVSSRLWMRAQRERTKVGSLQATADQLPPSLFLGGVRSEFEPGGRSQLICLLREGLEPHSHVLDVGCGSLRGGYWLIHFLDPGCYFGIEPDPKRLEIGLRHFLEPETRELKRPVFDDNDRFDFTVFGTEFDFVLARSIWSHATRDQIRVMLDSFAKGAPDGAMITSYLPAGRLRNRAYTGQVWRRGGTKGPRLAPHPLSWIRGECARRGMKVEELSHSVIGRQVWLRIERIGGAHPPAMTG